MGIKFKSNEGTEYVEQYPAFRRWINRCIACGTEGHKPEMPPNDAPGFKGQTLRKYFSELSVDENGMCNVCAMHATSKIQRDGSQNA
jgi:hypothetical protein